MDTLTFQQLIPKLDNDFALSLFKNQLLSTIKWSNPKDWLLRSLPLAIKDAIDKSWTLRCGGYFHNAILLVSCILGFPLNQH